MPDILEWLRPLLEGMGTILFAFLIALARQWIKKIADERLRDTLGDMVSAAEQLHQGPLSGAAKKAYVLDAAAVAGLKPTDTQVEAAVYREIGFAYVPDNDD